MNEKAELFIKACEEVGILTYVVRGQDIHVGGISPEQASALVTYIQEAKNV